MPTNCDVLGDQIYLMLRKLKFSPKTSDRPTIPVLTQPTLLGSPSIVSSLPVARTYHAPIETDDDLGGEVITAGEVADIGVEAFELGLDDFWSPEAALEAREPARLG